MLVILSAVFSVIVILNLIPNVLVVLVLLRVKYSQTSINYLFINLALADILMATSLIPQYVLRPAYTHPDGWAGNLLCKLFTGGFTMWVGGCASTFMHVVIAIERFYATRPQNLQLRKLSGRKLRRVIVCCWIFAVLTETPTLIVMTYDKTRPTSCYENWDVFGKVYTSFTFVVDLVIPLILMAVLYTRTVIALWGAKGCCVNTAQRAIKSRKRVTKIAIIITVIHALSWLPDVTVYFLTYHVPGSVEYGGLLYHACVIPVGLGTCLNPIVYHLQSARFRKQLRKLLGCPYSPSHRKKPTRSESRNNFKEAVL